jgi:hypothetical protein
MKVLFQLVLLIACYSCYHITSATTSIEQQQDHHHHVRHLTTKQKGPKPVIFDTDYGPFIDDGTCLFIYFGLM